MNLRLALHELAARYPLGDADTRRLQQLAGLDEPPTRLAYWLSRGSAVLAAALGGCGVLLAVASSRPLNGPSWSRRCRLLGRWTICLFGLLGLLGGPVAAGEDEVIVYPAYGTARGALVEGRVVERRASNEAGPGDGKLRNLVRSARLFRNDERAGRPVTVIVNGREWPAKSDDEGYFQVELDATAALPPGWTPVEARIGEVSGRGELLVVPAGNKAGLISDLDDTILVSEVTDKSRLLANTFLKNPAQRQAVPGMAALYARQAGANPVPAAAPLIYLSASPRQLQRPIAAFLTGNHFPPGVLITKRVTNDASSEPLTDQFAYKTQKIGEIFERLPAVRFVLVGDDGERDPEIYEEMRRRHPDRVAAIWIRQVHPDPARPKFPGQRNLSEILDQPESAELK